MATAVMEDPPLVRHLGEIGHRYHWNAICDCLHLFRRVPVFRKAGTERHLPTTTGRNASRCGKRCPLVREKTNE